MTTAHIKIRSYKDLEVWQLSVDLSAKVYRLTATFPKEERFGIVSQANSAVVSVPANIAESFGRFHYKDKINFLYNARGSLLELESHLAVADTLGFVTTKNRPLYNEIMQDITRLGIKLNNYRTKIRNLSNTT